MKNTLFFFLFLSAQTFAYPIDPRPLRMLIEESQYIIIGFVEDVVKTSPLPKDGGNDSKAVIEVREVLQGKIEQTLVEVPYIAAMTCPTPPSYEVGTLVLVFLNKKDGIFSTHALSYGAKTLNTQKDLALYKARIQEMQAISKGKNAKKRFEQTVEWLVKCAENPETTWEGTSELSPDSDWMSHYKKHNWFPSDSFLSRQQKERLKTAFFEQYATHNYVDFGLLDLVHDMDTDAIDKILLDYLKHIETEDLYNVDICMERLLHRTKDKRAIEIKEAYSTYYSENIFYALSLENLERIWGYINGFIALVEH